MNKVEVLKGFIPRNKKSVWIFKLDGDYKMESGLEGYSFDSEWLQITAKGRLVIKKGYAWDGCSPKKMICGKVVGTPDGLISKKSGKPKTYYASLVHDALYQYYGYHGIPRKTVDRLFYHMLKKSGFKASFIYHLAVRVFGGLIFGKREKVKFPGREYFTKFWELNRRLITGQQFKTKSPTFSRA